MADVKKTSLSAAALLSAALSGAGLHAQLAPAQPAATAAPVSFRWTKDHRTNVTRYLIGVQGTGAQGAFAGDVACDLDGTAKRYGALFAAGDELCAVAVAFGATADKSITAIAAQLAAPAPPMRRVESKKPPNK